MSYLDRIKAMKPLDRFAYYIAERFRIRENRLHGNGIAPEDWTDDPIFRKYKFTNVKRKWDYTSQWLIKNWYEPHGQKPHGGIAAVFARFTCLVSTFELVGFPSGDTDRWVDQSLKKMEDAAKKGRKIFTSAYMIAGGASAGRSKVEWVMNDIVRVAGDTSLITLPWKGTAMQFHDELKHLDGFGDFMTQEVVLDLMETYVLGNVKDKRTYGWAGPGAIRGLRWIAGGETKSEKKPNRMAARDQMIELRAKMMEHKKIPSSLALSLTVHDIEFCLCEFDKYSRTLFGHSEPKQLFKPRSIPGGLGL